MNTPTPPSGEKRDASFYASSIAKCFHTNAYSLGDAERERLRDVVFSAATIDVQDAIDYYRQQEKEASHE